MNLPRDTEGAFDAPASGSAAAAASRYEARLFGPFRLTAPDGSTATPGGRKARAALACVLLAAGAPVSRDRLCGLLWGDRGEEQARASLRQALYEMRALSAGEQPLLLQERAHVQLATSQVRTDLDRLRDLAGARDADGLAALLREQSRELLSDMDGIAQDVDEWLAAERIRHGDERRRLVLEVATAALDGADAAGALRLVAALLAFDATDERATRVAIEASHRLGDRDGARQAFARLDKALRTEVGVTPSQETSALYQRVMSSATPAPVAAIAPAADEPVQAATPPEAAPVRAPTEGAAPPVARRGRRGWGIAAVGAVLVAGAATWWSLATAPVHRVILVQPLQVAAGDADALALRNGLAADLARMLVGHDAALTVADSDDRAATGAGAADFMLTGEVQTAGRELHAGIKLSRRKDAAILWSSTFTRPAAELDAMREQMSSKIADVAACALGGHHPAPEQLDLETTRLYLAACEQKHGDWQASVHLLKQVVARNPGFAHGWAMLAAGTATNASQLPDDEVAAAYRDADAAARRALALDPKDGEALYARATTLPGMRHWAERMALLETGHAVDPDNGVVTGTLSWNLALVGRMREATMLARQAVDADPYSALELAYLAELVARGGDPAEARQLLAGARRRFPLVEEVGRTDFRVEALFGDPGRALHMLDDGPGKLVLSPQSEASWRVLLAARIEPSTARADAAVDAIFATAASNSNLGLRALERLLVVGRLDDARRFSAGAPAADADNEDQDILFSRLLQPLRADPRFMRLAARQGLAAVWSTSGQWPDFCADKSLGYDCRAEAARVATLPARSAASATVAR